MRERERERERARERDREREREREKERERERRENVGGGGGGYMYGSCSKQSSVLSVNPMQFDANSLRPERWSPLIVPKAGFQSRYVNTAVLRNTVV